MLKRIRLDRYLIDHNYCQTRSQAQQLITLGMVTIDDEVITKNNTLVNSYNNIVVHQSKYVSRGGLKLEHALKNFNISLNNKVVLDIGASTGGFTDCCLQHGAKIVYAVDVGTNQLHPSLLANPKVISYENTNLKTLTSIFFNHTIDVIVCDVSFISLKQVFVTFKSFCLSNKKIVIICLIKPQFELTPQIMRKNRGHVNNEKHRQLAIDSVLRSAKDNNLQLVSIVQSPILGNKKHNIEYLGYFRCQK